MIGRRTRFVRSRVRAQRLLLDWSRVVAVAALGFAGSAFGAAAAGASAPDASAAAPPGVVSSGLAHPPAWAAGRRIHFEPSPGAAAAPAQAGGALALGGNPLRRAGEEVEGAGVGGPLLYHSGGHGVQHSPKLYVIFWGSNFNTTKAGEEAYSLLMKLYEGLSGSAYQGILAQYFDATGRISSTVTVTPYVDARVTAPLSVSQSKVEAEVREAIEARGWTREQNAQFIVVTAPGSTFESLFVRGFCAYHGTMTEAGVTFPYAFVPYQGDAPFGERCLEPERTKNPVRETAKAASHEYAETATDPLLDAWFARKPSGEIGDLCQSEYDLELPDGAWVQNLYDNYLLGCRSADLDPPFVYAITEYDEPTGATETKALSSTVYAESQQTSYWIEYGLTAAYGQRTPAHSLSGTTLTATVTPTLTGLVAGGELYHYRLVAANSTGTSYGADNTFRTGPSQEWRLNHAPITGSEVPVDLTGQITLTEIHNGSGMSCLFSAEPTIRGTSGTISSLSLSSCTPSGGCSRLKAESVGDLPWTVKLYEPDDGLFERVKLGPDGHGAPEWKMECESPGSFTSTWWGEPILGTVNLSEGDVEGKWEGEVAFETEFGSQYPGHDRQPTSMLFKAPGKTLTVEAPAASAQAPAVSTLAASAVSVSAATLQGQVTPRRQATSYHFEYGKTTSYGTSVPVPSGEVGSGVAAVAVSQRVTGLEAKAKYHYRLVASNATGTSDGEDRTFTAAPGWFVDGREAEEAAAVSSKGTVKVSDAKVPIFGNSTVECSSAGEVGVGPGGAGEVTHVTLTGCKGVVGACGTGAATVTAVDLPWRTTLASSEGTTRVLLSEDGKGAPGFKYRCNSSGLEDTCTGNTSALVKTASGGVEEAFDSHSEKLSCTQGGSGQGTVAGGELLEDPASATLGLEGEAGAWLIDGRHLGKPSAVSSKGTVKVSDAKVPIFGNSTVECSSAGEVGVGPGGAGETTKLTLSGCKGVVGACGIGGSATVTAVDLPWRTVLATSEGTTRVLFSEDGRGAPGFKYRCNVSGLEDTCTGSTSAAVKIGSGGVEEVFDSHSGALNCTQGGSGQGTVAGSELLEDPANGGVLTYEEVPL